jgi:hypothetical protein
LCILFSGWVAAPETGLNRLDLVKTVKVYHPSFAETPDFAGKVDVFPSG